MKRSFSLKTLEVRTAAMFATAAILGLACHSWGQATSCNGLCLQQVSCSNNVTTTLIGTVYAPNGIDPVPNVLVYVPNAPVQPFAPGTSAPTVSGLPLASTTTGTDGTFTLTNMPVGNNIPVVFQIGKWRGQAVIPSVPSCVTTTAEALVTRLPGARMGGDLPRIAIVTGSADAEECLLRKMGMADSEFSSYQQPGGVVGSVDLFLGDGSPGANAAGALTPTEDALWAPQAMNAYDVIMLPDQGVANDPGVIPAAIVSFADAGGRVLATHFSYDGLYNTAPFSTTAQWAVDPLGSNQFASDPQAGYINTAFPRGQQMAQWLQIVGASTTLGQIPLANLHDDVSSVIAPSLEFLNVTDANLGTVPMQFSFDTPVGAPPAQQVGRVVFNDFVVEHTSNTGGMVFPSECGGVPPSPMTPQEKLLEYSLFDAINFLSPPLPPAAAANVTNSPAVFAPGDIADTLTIDVVTGSSALNAGLTVTPNLPAGLTPVSVAVPITGGGVWSCTLSPLSCSAQNALFSSVNVSISVTVSVAANITGPLAVSATVSGGGLGTSVTGSDGVPVSQTQTITFTTGNPSVAAYGSSFTVAAIASSGLAVTYSASGSCANAGATYTITSGAGVCSVTASQAGNGSYAPTSGTETVTASLATSSIVAGSEVNPSVNGQPVTFVAVVLPQPMQAQITGTVAFKDGAVVLGTTSLDSDDNASITISTLSLGSHSITARYSGDANTRGSASSILIQKVQSRVATTISVASSPNPSNVGQVVTVTATVSSSSGIIPDGEVVTFKQGTTILGTGTTVSGVATFTTSTLAAGSHTITASYPGDTSFQPSSKATTETVKKYLSETVVTGSPNPSNVGQAVTITATVSSSGGSIPDGEIVTFKQGTTILGTGTTVSGVATFTTSTLAAGSHTITASYPGDTSFQPSSKATTETVNKYLSETVVAGSPNPASVGQTITFTATVSSSGGAIPDGEVVTFKQGTTILGTGTTASGVATFTTSTLAAGTHTITASYPGDSSFQASSGSRSQTVK